MHKFMERFGGEVNAVVSGWDRIAIRGSLRWLASLQGIQTYASTNGILLKDFARWAQGLTDRIRSASSAVAQSLGIACQYLRSSSIDKEALARQIATDNAIDTGPICMFSVVEPSFSPTVVGSRETRKLALEMRPRKCVWIYFYFNDAKFGLGHLRLQTWAPFTIKGVLNGRHWLERAMIQEGIGFIKCDNCFRWISDPVRAQQLFDEQLRTDWSAAFEALVDQYFPVMRSLFADCPLSYYWSVDQSEWASDIMFRDTATLDRLFPMLARHALIVSDSASVMRYLGRIAPEANLPPKLTGDIRGDRRRRFEGICVKHRDGGNSVKTYNKAGNVLRIETTINDTRAFKVFRTANDEAGREAGWLQMRKGVADLERRSRVSQASNNRYADALSGCQAGATLLETLDSVTKPAERKGRRVRALNPCSEQDLDLLKFLTQGQWTINGLRNRDLAQWLNPRSEKLPPDERTRLSSRASRLLVILQAHGLVQKVQRSHRYMVTSKGQQIAALMSSASTIQSTKVMEMAA
jgi:hypothetical protein